MTSWQWTDVPSFGLVAFAENHTNGRKKRQYCEQQQKNNSIFVHKRTELLISKACYSQLKLYNVGKYEDITFDQVDSRMKEKKFCSANHSKTLLMECMHANIMIWMSDDQLTLRKWLFHSNTFNGFWHFWWLIEYCIPNAFSASEVFRHYKNEDTFTYIK